MSIAIKQTTLASRRANVFNGVGEKMYGRIERASATGSGSAATRRSYLPHHPGHLVGPVLEGVIAHDSASQLGADLRPGRRCRRDHRPERVRKRGRVAWGRNEVEREP